MGNDFSRCLKSLRGVSDEIVVGDTCRVDRTINIAREFGARVFEFARFDGGLDEDVVVTALMEDGLAVAAIEDAVPHAAAGGSGRSWHAITVRDAHLAVNIRYVPNGIKLSRKFVADKLVAQY